MVLRLSLAIWLCLWTYIAFPWRSFQSTPTLKRVELIPFPNGPTRSQVLNVLAFVPLGILATRTGSRPATVIFFAAAVSSLTEVAQLFSSRRYPSTTDVILNTAGACAGVVIVLVWRIRTREATSV